MPPMPVQQGTTAGLETRGRSLPVIEISARRQSILADCVELWNCRELVLNFVYRDLATRYRQTILGALWALLQPLGMMIVMAVVFGRFMHAPTDNVPYPLFCYAALLPWQYFSSALTRASNSVLGAGGLLKKIYLPRLSIPLASVVPALVDFTIASLLLLVLFPIYNVHLTWNILFLPLFMGLVVCTTLGIGLWVSALHVKFRDIFHIVPFVLQMWMFASPVVYSSTSVPEHLRVLYNLNPLVAVIDGFRWCLLGAHTLSLESLISAFCVTAILLTSGIIYFRATEGSFADYV